jgi:DNA polymerase III delta subunit
MVEGQSPFGILIDLSRRVFLLKRLRTMLDAGVPEGEIASVLRLKTFFMRLYMNQVRQFSGPELARALDVLVEADYAMKCGLINPDLGMVLVIHALVRGTGGRSIFRRVPNLS